MAGVLIATILAVGALVWIVVYVVRQETVRRARVDEELHDVRTPTLEYEVRQETVRRARVDEELHDVRTPTLEYEVPTGQDPAVILAALEREGYTATVDPAHAHQLVLIACPTGIDSERARVREVIQAASVSAMTDGVPLQVEVRFCDE